MSCPVLCTVCVCSWAIPHIRFPAVRQQQPLLDPRSLDPFESATIFLEPADLQGAVNESRRPEARYRKHADSLSGLKLEILAPSPADRSGSRFVLSYFFFYSPPRTRVLILYFVQYYSVICHPSDHTLWGGPPGRDLNPGWAGTLTTRPPCILDLSN